MKSPFRANTLLREVTNCLGVFDHFVGLALKGLKHFRKGFLEKNCGTYINIKILRTKCSQKKDT